MKLNTSELDCIYLSFDEPDKEKHWAMLQHIAPWSKRVDGVRGFDAAHKACAALSDTDYLITIDGDNQVYPDFLDLVIDVPQSLENSVLSWNSINVINGLTYGNGGVKIWPKKFIEQMQSHENAVDPTHAVDFCWDRSYIQLNNIYSTTHPNGSPLQAFRAGFREGCKMTLDNGQTVSAVQQIVGSTHHLNILRLLVWGSVGMDCENGKWAILGTRLGAHYTNIEKRDITIIRDYDALSAHVAEYLDLSEVEFNRLLATVTADLSEVLGLDFVELDAKQSLFFKKTLPRHPRFANPLVTEQAAQGGTSA
jgi:hypothetical protein